jgi:hypothetical protein
MSSSNKVFKGDIGTKIILDAGSDISTGTSFSIVYQKPDGTTGSWTAILEGTQRIYYLTQSGDLDQIGAWKLQLRVELPSWQGRGEIAELTIYEKIEITV